MIMKELTIEQKASAYDEAIRKAKITLGCCDSASIVTKNTVYDIFPELQNSEDERIRKGLIKAVSGTLKGNTLYGTDVTREEAIAWLEKQKNTSDKEYVFRPLAGDTIEKAAEQAVKLDGKVVLAFNGAYIPVGNKTKNEIVAEYHNWAKKQGEQTSLQTNERAWLYLVSDVLTWKDGIGQYLDNPRVQELAKKLCSEYAQKLYNSTVFSNSSNIKNDEQKPADKIKPKFHEGDWITNGDHTWKIVEVKPLDYILQSQDGNIVDDNISYVDKEFNLWTIADAKDGDVLVTDFGENDSIVMYKSRCTIDTINVHCCLDNKFTSSNIGVFNAEDVKPATKHQHDLLFQAMKEKGWEWNNDKKELKTIEHKFNVDDWIVTDDSFGKIVRHVDEISFNIIDKGYVLSDENGLFYNLSFDKEHKWHKWTIQDAEDGDVLAADVIESHPSPFVAICKKQDGKLFETYCFIGHDGKFYDGEIGHVGEYVHPATKEQCDLLFQKMKEAEWEWNNETKELNKMDVINKDNNDEKIRKNIIELVKQSSEILNKQNQKDMLAWLEKQCEKKIADKVEPKFKEGDYIVLNNITSSEIWRVINIDKDNYYNIKCITNLEYDEIYRIPGFVLEKDYRLWTIQDAKRGDVLIDAYGNIGIFDKCYDFDWMSCCSLVNNGGFQYFTVKHKNEKTYPATKEQRDLLFQKMKEAGWEWDSEKKEANKIGQNHADKVEPKFKVGDWITFYGGKPFKILKIEAEVNGNLDYLLLSQKGHDSFYNKKYVDENARLWTIQDAKDGDVLVCNINKGEIGGDVEKLPNITPTICIYQNVDKDHDYIHSYCSLYDEKYLVPQNRMYYNTFVHNIHPATKEQCDLLFNTILNEGYEWDAEKKEMSKQTLKITPKFCAGQVITDDNGTWYKIKNIKCLDDWHYELYDICEDNTYLELCSIIDEKFRANSFVHEIKKMLGD